MGCGCNKKKDPKELVNRAQDKLASKGVRTQQSDQRVATNSNSSFISTGKKPVLKTKK
jgi:hypothetical protein